MNRMKPIGGEFYRHFKGKLYQIKMLAVDSETQREMVVYQAMYAPYACYVRDLEEFMSPVDREKYPQAEQEYRFEHVLLEDIQSEETEQSAVGSNAENTDKTEYQCIMAENDTEEKDISDGEIVKALKSGQPDRYLENRLTDEEVAGRGFLLLLDAETFREKRQIFLGLRQYLNKHMLNNIAVALDIVLEDGDTDTQYESILRCMETFERYEGGRLR